MLHRSLHGRTCTDSARRAALRALRPLLAAALALAPSRVTAQDPEPTLTNGAGPARAFQAGVDFSPNIHVNLATGNVHVRVLTSRFSPKGLTPQHEILLSFNTLAVHTAGDASGGFGLGAGWSSSLGGGLSFPNANEALLSWPDGTQLVLALDATSGTWRSSVEQPVALVEEPGGWLVTRPDHWTWRYDSSGALVEVRDEEGNAYVITRQGGRPVSAVDPSGRGASFGYANDQLETITDSMGHVWTLAWQDGRLASVSDPQSGSVAFTWDAAGRVRQFTDAGGGTWLFTYFNAGESQHRVRAVTDPTGQRAFFSYAHGDPPETTMMDARGEIWRAAHDALDPPALVSRTDALGHIWLLEHDAARLPVSVTTPSGATWTWEHDELGRVTAVTDPLGLRVESTYDAWGNCLTRRFDKALTTWRYDDPQHPLRLTSREELLDGAGNVASTTFTWFGASDGSPPGAWNGRLASLTDAMGTQTRFEYDALGALVAIHEGPPNASGRFEGRYDVPPANAFVDHGGMTLPPDLPACPALPAPLLSPLQSSGWGSRDWSGQTLTRSLQFLAPLAAASGGSPLTTRNEVVARDALGRPFSRDLVSDEPFEGLAAPPPPIAFGFAANYDDLAGTTLLTTTAGGSVLIERDLDARIDGVTASLGAQTLLANLARDADGRLTQITHGDGKRTELTWLANGQPESLEHFDGAKSLLRLDYSFDSQGALASVVETTPSGKTTTTWEHDLAGRLTRETRNTGGVVVTDHYSWDKAGNRRTRKHLESGAAWIETLFYDIDAPAAFSSHNNRLVAVERRSLEGKLLATTWITYENPHGNASRIVRRAADSSTITSTVFVHDGKGSPWLAFDESWTETPAGPVGVVRSGVIETRQVGGAARLWQRRDPVSFAPIGDAEWRFTFGPVEASVDVDSVTGVLVLRALRVQGLGRVDGAGAVPLLPDHLGSARLEPQQGSLAVASYSAWGERLAGATPAPDAGFSAGLGVRQASDGAEFTDARLLVMGHRWYAPEFGRFLMRDPIGVAGGSNVYAFAHNRPTMLTDPKGLAPHGGIYPAPEPFIGPPAPPIPPAPPQPPTPPVPAPEGEVYGPPLPPELLPLPPRWWRNTGDVGTGIVPMGEVPIFEDDEPLGPVAPPQPGDPEFIGPLLPPEWSAT